MFQKAPCFNQRRISRHRFRTEKTYQLENSNHVKYDSVKVFYDNTRIYSDYEVNTETGRVTCIAPEGVIITCDYESDYDIEIWRELSLASRYELPDYDISDFRFSRHDYDIFPDDINSEMTVCAVKIALISNSGHIEKESLGKGAGIMQMYKLSHKVKDGNIEILSNNKKLTAKNFSLMNDTQYIKIAASSGHVLTASYDWVSESPVVRQFIAVFSE